MLNMWANENAQSATGFYKRLEVLDGTVFQPINVEQINRPIDSQ